MIYTTFTRPDGKHTAESLVRWALDERLLLNLPAELSGRVCAVCWGATGVTDGGSHFPKCYQCNEAARRDATKPFGRLQVADLFRSGDPLTGIVPISYSLQPLLESAIWRAKNERQSRWLNSILAALLQQFLSKHWVCIERRFNHIDVVTVVPSHPSAREGWDHLGHLVERVDNSDSVSWPHAERWNPTLLSKTITDHTDRAVASGRYAVTGGTVTGQRVLLIDDTFTTGGTLRSAAADLRSAGARSVVAVTIGRQANRSDIGKYLWNDLVQRYNRGDTFSLDTCVVHDGRLAALR